MLYRAYIKEDSIPVEVAAQGMSGAGADVRTSISTIRAVIFAYGGSLDDIRKLWFVESVEKVEPVA